METIWGGRTSHSNDTAYFTSPLGTNKKSEAKRAQLNKKRSDNHN